MEKKRRKEIDLVRSDTRKREASGFNTQSQEEAPFIPFAFIVGLANFNC